MFSVKTRSFLYKTIDNNNYFILIKNNFKVFKIHVATFEFKVTVNHSLWQNASNCDPLTLKCIRGVHLDP